MVASESGGRSSLTNFRNQNEKKNNNIVVEVSSLLFLPLSSVSNAVPYVALWSGMCAAMASSLAKVVFSRDSVVASTTVVVMRMLDPQHQTNAASNDLVVDDSLETTEQTSLLSLSFWEFWTWYEIGIRLFFLLAMIGCNLIAVGTFVQGLEESGSVKGTALTTAANCLVSTLLGIFLWSDPVPSKLGLLCVLVGILVLVVPSSPGGQRPQEQQVQQQEIIERTTTTTTTTSGPFPSKYQASTKWE